MAAWEQYQRQAAGLLREIGFTAEVDARLTAAHGALHAIDIAARRVVAGVDVLWIVECKHRGSPVDMGMVRELGSRVIDLGADRGLLLSESGFRSGAIRTARQKNITLTGLADLRADAADQILATRVTVAEKRLMDLTLKVNRDLRPFAMQTPRMLAVFAASFPPEIIEEFAARPDAVAYRHGIAEVLRQVDGLTPEDHPPFIAHPGELAMPWRSGVDHDVMDDVAAAIHHTTQALYQGALGQWPAMSPAPSAMKLSWSMAQLIDVVESILPDLERKTTEQEAKAARPRLSRFHFIKGG